MTIALFSGSIVLTLSIVFASLTLVGFASIQDGEGLISNKERNIGSNPINTNTPSNLSTKYNELRLSLFPDK